MRSLRSNLARCGVRNVINIRIDSRKFPETNIKADRILLDAPCTGEGLMAVDKKRRTTKNSEDIQRLSQLQKELFESALKCLKKNGSLIYSTCSTAPEENEEIIDWALTKFPIEILDTGLNSYEEGLIHAFDKEYDSTLKKARRLYPHLHGTEGFFICKVKLKEEVS